MSETIKIHYGAKWFKIFYVFYFLTSVVEARAEDSNFIVIERVVLGDVNYLALKFHPVGVPLPDLGIEFWIHLPEYRRTWNTSPYVEFGPGTYKSKYVKPEPNYFGKTLKVLLDLKKKKLEKYKDLNAGKKFS